jgi:hypothetical protein
MRRLPVVAVLSATLLVPVSLHAQSLSQRFTQLFTFGDCGEALCLNVDVVGGHGQHYLPSVTQGENDLLAFVTGSISTSLANLPFTAATGGVAFEFVDGAPVATAVSTGGIFGERSQTLGRGRLLVGANVNSLRMDAIRGVPLRDLTFRFAHQNVGDAAMGDPGFENDIIEVRTDLDVDLLVTSAFASYGVHENVDVGILIPIVRASLSGTSEAQVIPFDRPTPHLFGTVSQPSEFADAASSGSAIGIGDIALRVKANLYQEPGLGFGVAADVRLPTGDSANFLGSGQTSLRALGIVSGRRGNFSPHLNAGVAIRTGETQPNSIIGALGFDHLMAEGITLAVDLLGDFALGDSPLRLPESVVFDEPARRRVRLSDIPERRDHQTDASVGLKMQLPGEYRVIANVLAPLTDGGMRPRYLWTFGLERAF